MKFIPTRLRDVVIVEPAVFGDDRGWFMESFNQKRFDDGLASLGLPPARPFVQDNHSRSQRGVLRGLHYQLPPHAQGKLVRVVSGSVFDVAVDIRKGSPTFGQWYGTELSSENGRQLYIPPGYAHGFCVLSERAGLLYKCTDYYVPSDERGIRWNDPGLAIPWPAMSGAEPWTGS